MKGVLAIIIGVIVLAAGVHAQPHLVDGKQYYVVDGSDPSMDTGDEVCGAHGLDCAGYTLQTEEACQQEHPDAAVIQRASGDASTVYCDGPPQTGICAGLEDTCLGCPTCTNSVSCGTAIGGLYKEMYVECTNRAGLPGSIPEPPGALPPRSSLHSDTCKLDPNARTVGQLLDEIPMIDQQVRDCPATLPSSFGTLPDDGSIHLDIMDGPSVRARIALELVNTRVDTIEVVQLPTSRTCKQKLVVQDDVMDTILQSPDRADTVQRLYTDGSLRLEGCTFMRKVTTFFTRPISRFFVRRTIQPPTSAPQTVPDQPGYRVCDFYEHTKDLVSCTAPRADDTFCVITTGATNAVALGCQDGGQILCGIPCGTRQADALTRCGFDGDRTRGTQAAPLDFCPPAAQQTGQPSQATLPAGKPDRCDETYMQGWPEYAPNRQLWDSYMADASGICQFQQGVYPTAECAHTVQLSRGGYPFYLCWYR